MTYNTGKRKEILRYLCGNSDKAFTLAEIADAVCPDGRGKSTVYRLVSELTEENLIKRLSDGKTRHCAYQYIGNDECKNHLHLKCRDCGILIHLDHEFSHTLSDTLERSGFSLEEGAMLFGKCQKCKGLITK
jgi:Fur family ferric uptake transcriptional regulator